MRLIIFLLLPFSLTAQLSTNQLKQVKALIATDNTAQAKIITANKAATDLQIKNLLIANKAKSDSLVEAYRAMDAFIKTIDEQQQYIDRVTATNQNQSDRILQLSDSSVNLYNTRAATNKAIEETYNLALRNRGLINDGKAATDALTVRVTATEQTANNAWNIAKEIWTVILPPDQWDVVTDIVNRTKTLRLRK